MWSKNGDALLHAAAATILCTLFVLATTPWVYMAVANGCFWLGREVAQKPDKNLLMWSTHKHIEWLLPTIVGIIASYVAHRYS